jgi:hypothetical protein
MEVVVVVVVVVGHGSSSWAWLGLTIFAFGEYGSFSSISSSTEQNRTEQQSKCRLAYS